MKSNGKITKIYNLRGKLNFPIPEDGIDTSDATAVIEDIKQGKTVYARGQKLTGTMPNRGSVTISPNTVSQEHDSGYYDSIKVNAVTNEIDANIKSENIKDGISILGVEGNLVELNGQTITVAPSTTEKVINPEEGYNGITQVTVEAVTNNIDTNIKQENIKKDVSILGITGTLEEGIDTSDANAAAANIEINKTAYVNGQKITGTIPTATTITEDGSVQLESDGRFRASATVPNDIYLHSDITPRMIWLNLTKSQVAETIGLTADKIVSGNTILDVAGTASITGTDTSDATASANDIRFGESAYVNGEKIEGSLSTIFNLGYQVDSVVWTDETEQNQLKLDIPVNNSGIVNAGSSKIAVILRYDKLAEEIGLTAEKIKAGETILGITGTYTGDVESV